MTRKEKSKKICKFLHFIYNCDASFQVHLLLYIIIMAKFDISAEIRGNDEKLSEIRNGKRVPAVVYGKTQEPISLTVDASDFLRLFRKAGESNIISLSVGKKKMDVLIHSTQKQPVT